ncbi:hypothetical protein DHD80_14195 [Gramella sp. AN32]|nr:hypothetical protein [Gramella sp. AN32]
MTLFSCSEEKESSLENVDQPQLSTNDYPQQWKLFKMTGSFDGSETTGEEMEWQETYYFYQDKSFKKVRIKNNISVEAKGSFEILMSDEEAAFILTYNQPSELIGNCTGDLKEHLSLRENNTVLQSSWMACDGPGLFYKRKN